MHIKSQLNRLKLKRKVLKTLIMAGLKRNKEMNQLPRHLRHLASIIKNPSIPLFPYDLDQSEKGDLPKSLAFSRVPKLHFNK